MEHQEQILREISSQVWGNTYLPTLLCDPRCILTNGSVFQQHLRIQCSFDRDETYWREWSQKSRSIRWLKTHRQPSSQGVRSPTWRLGALSQCDHYHGREVWKFLHWPCTTSVKCTCRCTSHWPFQPEPSINYSSTIGTCTVANSPLKIVKLQEETFKLKRFLRLWQVSKLGLVIPLRQLRLIWHIAWWPQGGSCHQNKNSSILLQCNHAGIISSIVWWNPSLIPFTQRGIGSTQRRSWWYVQSSPTRT